MLTPWGYSVTALSDILSAEDFHDLTAGEFEDVDEDTVSAVLSAASYAVRNWCGWHVAPSLACTADVVADGKFIALPTLALTGVTEIEEDGETLASTEYAFQRNGLIRRGGFKQFAQGWGALSVSFTSGFAECPDVCGVVSQIAATALASPAGVWQETAGNVSIRFNQTAEKQAGGFAVLPHHEAILGAYRLPEVL